MKPKLGKNNQQWIFDYIIRTTGKTAHWELDALADRLPAEARTWDMIPKVLAKKAARQEEFARKAEESGHFSTAQAIYSMAYHSYFLGQHVICEDDNPEKIRLNQKYLYCNEKVRKYSTHPIEKIEIPWGDKTVPALLHLLPDKNTAPCILYIPGMDQAKESFPGTGTNPQVDPNPFIVRGMHVLCIDGPGQGECNLRKIRVYPDNHVEAAKAAINYLVTRPEVDINKIGLYGVSMGSYWVSHIAAADNRVKATIAAMGCFMMNRHTIFEEASPRFRLTYKYMAGIEDDDEFDNAITNNMTLKGVGSHIKNPFLVWVGEFDPLSPLDEAESFFNEVVGPKEMWIMEDDFHNNFARGLYGLPMAVIAADWLKDKLHNKYPENMIRKKLIPINGTGPYD